MAKNSRSIIEKKVTDLLKRTGELQAPVNVDRIASHLGVVVETKDLEDNVSGFLVNKGIISVIGVNKNHSKERKRFTIAHELGHFILHDNNSLFVDQYKGPMYRNEKSSTGEINIEREANYFAACLLMPAIMVKKELGLLPDFFSFEQKKTALSKKFKVSKEAMEYRLQALDISDYGF